MYKYACLNAISQKGLSCFDANYVKTDDIQGADAILVRSANMHEMHLDDSVLAIARAGAGVNNIPLDKYADRGVVVFNTPGANANGVKEMVFAGMLLAARDIVGGVNWINENVSDLNIAKDVEKQKKQYAGTELSGKKLGIIGLGAIGCLVANAAVHMGMDVYGYDPYISVNAAWSLSRWVKHVTNLAEIFAECDYITIHVPLNDETRGIIGRKAIAQMKKGIRILNLARGELVDEEALLEGLKDGTVARYVTDFATYRLAHSENVLALPHLGASTPEAEENCARMAVQELRDYLENGNIRNSVNMPAIVEPRMTAHRICIIHRNVPNMLAQLTSVIGANHINIENMVNKARGEYAYTMIDTNSEVHQSAFDQIDNVIRVRVI